MERAGSFTAVPGLGGVAMGITALGAAAIASLQDSSLAWLLTWVAEAFIAIGIASWTTYSKAHDAGSALFSGPGRRFVYSFAPPIFVGALLTIVHLRSGEIGLMPGQWPRPHRRLSRRQSRLVRQHQMRQPPLLERA